VPVLIFYFIWFFSPRRSQRGTLGFSSPGGPVEEPVKPFCSFFSLRRLSSSGVFQWGSLRQTLDLSKTTNEKVPWRRPSKTSDSNFFGCPDHVPMDPWNVSGHVPYIPFLDKTWQNHISRAFSCLVGTVWTIFLQEVGRQRDEDDDLTGWHSLCQPARDLRKNKGWV
jgi:hypothetical protein